MPMNNEFKEGRFIKRLNRFVGLVNIDEYGPIPVHVPSSGRMSELLVHNAPVIVQPFEQNGKHKTQGRLVRVLYQGNSGSWVSVDSHLPNRLFSKVVKEQHVPEFREYQQLRPEVTFGESRLDFLGIGEDRQAFIEVKSVTLVEDGVALFPDAPTARGTRHIKALVEALEMGYDAFLVFVVQRGDADSFSPHGQRDPVFAQSVREAVDAGVVVLAYDCHVTPAEVTWRGPLPVILDRR